MSDPRPPRPTEPQEDAVAPASPDPSTGDGRGRGPEGDRPRRRLSKRAKLGLVLLALLLLAAADLSRPPAEQWSARFLLAGIDLYQATLSPRMPDAGVQCRFTPTCSHYAEGAIRKDGALVGSVRTVGRIARCGPWTPAGTHDPP